MSWERIFIVVFTLLHFHTLPFMTMLVRTKIHMQVSNLLPVEHLPSDHLITVTNCSPVPGSKSSHIPFIFFYVTRTWQFRWSGKTHRITFFLAFVLLCPLSHLTPLEMPISRKEAFAGLKVGYVGFLCPLATHLAFFPSCWWCSQLHAADNGKDVFSHPALQPRQRNALWSSTGGGAGGHSRRFIT